jgi:ABC-type uncharacterized transport system substrate-binding protein
MLKTDRRKFMALLGWAATSSISWSLAVDAQSRLPVIGWINMRPRSRVGAAAGFVDGLRDAGLVEGRDFMIDYRSADEQYDRLPGLAAELVQRRVSVLAAPGGMALAAAARDATSTIPILFMIGSDPVELGLVKSFSPPCRRVPRGPRRVFERARRQAPGGGRIAHRRSDNRS